MVILKYPMKYTLHTSCSHIKVSDIWYPPFYGVGKTGCHVYQPLGIVNIPPINMVILGNGFLLFYPNCIDITCYIMLLGNIYTGWWFGTFFIFPYIGNNHPNWLIFFRGVQTTNQLRYLLVLSHLSIFLGDVFHCPTEVSKNLWETVFELLKYFMRWDRRKFWMAKWGLMAHLHLQYTTTHRFSSQRNDFHHSSVILYDDFTVFRSANYYNSARLMGGITGDILGWDTRYGQPRPAGKSQNDFSGRWKTSPGHPDWGKVINPFSKGFIKRILEV